MNGYMRSLGQSRNLSMQVFNVGRARRLLPLALRAVTCSRGRELRRMQQSSGHDVALDAKG